MVSQKPFRIVLRRIGIGALLLSGVAIVGVYSFRKPLAGNWIDSELRARGIAGHYKLTQLDFDHQRLEHVVIGGADHPDLTADWIEVETHVGLFGASVQGVKAGGVRLHAVLAKDGSLHFGALDKLRGPSNGPLVPPDLNIDLSDGQLALDTPKGAVQAKLSVTGNPAHTLMGHVSASADPLLQPYLADAAKQMSAIKGTPLAPLGEELGKAIAALNGGLVLESVFKAEQGAMLTLTDVKVNSTSGALFILAAPGNVVISRDGTIAFHGVAQLGGGGFPQGEIALAGNPNQFSGVARFTPYAAGQTRLSLLPIQFSRDPRGVHIATIATFDGALSNGTVRALKVPIMAKIGGAGGFALDASCLPIAFDALTVAGLSLGHTLQTMCMRGQVVSVANPRLSGRLGTAPFGFAAAGADYNLARKDFALRTVAVQLGVGQHKTQFATGTLSGALNATGIAGHYAGLSGVLPNVPLVLNHSTGTWQFVQGALDVKGNLDVADADPAHRFEPLASHDVKLRLAKGLIITTGTLIEPKSGALVSTVHITHALASDSGEAVLDVPGLHFGKGFQPEAVTRITLGVIADLKGDVSGQGRIRWSTKGVSSDGDFATDGLDLAAAFGPVTGMKGRIHFTDLLGLVTAPNQSVSLAEINPGVVVRDGLIHYRLLPNLKAEIEGGRFPFAGGSLILDPAVLDLSEAAERRMTIRVAGMDAAKFINQMQFEDIAATGIFDGIIPLVFDKNGGRIEGGHIAVAAEGGTLAYVGAVSNANLGRFGHLAFDALKSVKYHGLTIELGGALDGEMVTMVRFNGVNQAPIGTKKSYFLKQITGIPFKFNIQIKAPFRSLFTSAKHLQDPSDLVQQSLPVHLKASAAPHPDPVHPPANSVQTKESEPMR